MGEPLTSYHNLQKGRPTESKMAQALWITIGQFLKEFTTQL